MWLSVRRLVILNPQIIQNPFGILNPVKNSMKEIFFHFLKRTPNLFLSLFFWIHFHVIRRTFSYPQRQHKWNWYIYTFIYGILFDRDLIKIAHKHFYLFLLGFETTILLRKYNQQSVLVKKHIESRKKICYFPLNIFFWCLKRNSL